MTQLQKPSYTTLLALVLRQCNVYIFHRLSLDNNLSFFLLPLFLRLPFLLLLLLLFLSITTRKGCRITRDANTIKQGTRRRVGVTLQAYRSFRLCQYTMATISLSLSLLKIRDTNSYHISPKRSPHFWNPVARRTSSRLCHATFHLNEEEERSFWNLISQSCLLSAISKGYAYLGK